MHWSEEIATRIIERNPQKEEYVCAAGISPSGSIHIGNFRDIATSYFVVRALEKMGKKAKLLFSWDEFDRLRKIPVNVEKIDSDMGKYIGMPYVDVKNPFQENVEAKTYAQYFEHEFEESIKNFGIDMDYRYQAQMYRSGQYKEYILLSLKKRKEIFDVLDKHRTQTATEDERENYYPVSIYCSQCSRDTTKIVSLSQEDTLATYKCACGNEEKFDFNTNFNCKLAWKVDWPMRWMFEGVDFEPGGKDHASPNGSYDTSKDVSKEIFGYEPPIFQGYEFIGIKGATGKMSGSSGLNLTPEALLKMYQPEVILWLYSKTDPLKPFDFCFDNGILRQYVEFDKMLDGYVAGTLNEIETAIMYNTIIENRKVETVPMNHLVQFGSIVNFNIPMLETVFEKIGVPYKLKQFEDRLERARYWLYECAPGDVNNLRKTRDWEYFASLSETEKKQIEGLHKFIATGNYELDALNQKLYDIPKTFVDLSTIEPKELKSIQSNFFKAIYRLTINKETGPRLYLFLYAVNTEDYKFLLDFSFPKTEREIEFEELEKKKNEELVMEEEAYGEPDPVAPFKDTIELDNFAPLDLRVCKITKCAEIRKSNNCLKLTVFDGSGERTIVSSIKKYYTPEQLIGKKIIVIANLKPTRITGVTSEGMLLAATNTACGCKVVFVDDTIPEGTAVS